jgi:hypothetical protein
LSPWRARIRVDISFEFYFVTFILDQKRPPARDAPMVRTEEELTQDTFTNAQQFIDMYYEELWQQFDSFLGDWQSSFPGECFTEFRGMALRDCKNPFYQNPDGKRFNEAFQIPKLDSDLINESRKSLRDWLARNEPFVNELMQLKPASGTVDRDANCVLCELLDGAAIYCSATRQLDDRVTGVKRPLRYFILYNGLSKYQLGRLIRRAHALGEYRCAAVLDWEKIEKASQRIRALGNNIDRMLSEGRGGAAAPSGMHSESATLTDRQMQSVQSELNKLGDSDINGGLLYRVNRSRYYAGIFRQAILDMRPQKLEGWQTYDEFFRRNLYSHFDEIDEVGKRYEALAERSNRLIHARNAERLNDFQTTMIRIQHLGEIIGLAAFAYYGGHILSTLFIVICKWPCAGVDLHSCLRSVDDTRDFMDILGMLAAGLVAVGLYRLRNRRKSNQGAGSSSLVRPVSQ